MNTTRITSLLLRVAVAFALLFPALNAFFDPYAWIGYFPSFLTGIVPDLVLLHTFGVIEIILALWILSGQRIFIPSLLVTVLLVAIVLVNAPDFQVLFRDVPIALSALVLVILNRPHYSPKPSP